MKNRSEHQTSILRLVSPLVFLCIFFYLGMRYLGSEDFSYVLGWWATLLAMGFAFQPLTLYLFRGFHDGGWMFAKTLSIAISGWLMWFLSSCHILKFTRFNCFFVLTLCFVLNIAFHYFMVSKKKQRWALAEYYTPDRVCSMFSAEVLFFAVFLFWCYLKGINPDAFGTERYMDFGYMMTISRTDYMPAEDIWLSGHGINYYYVGQYLATYITKLAGVPVSYGYNLAMMTLAAMGFSLPYAIGVNIMRVFLKDRKNDQFSASEQETMARIGSVASEQGQPYWRPLFTGILSGLAVGFAGNMHYPIYKFLYPKLQRLRGEETQYSYWFPDATRFIGYQPDVDDKTIHEFPIYSYVIGDLHAHVINTIFVLTVIAILFAWLMVRKNKMDAVRLGKSHEKPTLLSEVFHPAILVSAFFVGLFHMTNYWDFPIYFVVCGAVILFSNLIVYHFEKEAWLLTAYQAAVFVVMGILVSLPFTLSFDSISTAIRLCDRHTSLYQLMVLWGLPVACVVVFFFVQWREANVWSATNNQRMGKPWIRRFMESMRISDLFVLTIGLCAIGLVLLPEIIYVKDIYSGAYKRANTMFKLTYQSFIMFGISMPYIIMKYVSVPKTALQKGFGIATLLLFSMTLGYFNEAYTAWFNGYYTTLDATTFIADDCNADDAEMIQYINENIDEQCVILEMCGLSYTYFNRISVFTGMSTVLGWQTHEWLWRSSGDLEYPEIVSERHDDILEIYTSTDEARVRELIKKYDIDYIYIGECELVDGYRQKSDSDAQAEDYDATQWRSVEGTTYKKIDTNISLLTGLGTIVKQIAPTDEKLFTTYLIRVER